MPRIDDVKRACRDEELVLDAAMDAESVARSDLLAALHENVAVDTTSLLGNDDIDALIEDLWDRVIPEADAETAYALARLRGRLIVARRDRRQAERAYKEAFFCAMEGERVHG